MFTFYEFTHGEYYRRMRETIYYQTDVMPFKIKVQLSSFDMLLRLRNDY